MALTTKYKDLPPKTRLFIQTGAVVGLVALLIFVLSKANDFHLPGIQMVNWQEGDTIPLWASHLTSNITTIPFKPYDLPLCKPDKLIEDKRNLGDLISGHVRQSSLYQIQMNKPDSQPRILCTKDYTDSQLNSLKRHISQKYRINWILDNLSVFVKVAESIYEQGFPLGHVFSKDKTILHNHHRINILYYKVSPTESSPNDPFVARVVGFEVEYFSVDWKKANAKVENGRIVEYDESLVSQPMVLKEGKTTNQVYWTYETRFIPSNIPWKSRWDNYFFQAHREFQWFSVIHALLIVAFLTVIVAMILTRTLKSDLFRYNNPSLDEYEEDYGWKMIHGDVFRPPRFPSFFASCIGSGVQIGVMLCATLLFAVLGFLSPAHRGALMTSLLVFFVLGGYAAGYTSARVYKNFSGKHWKRTTLRTSLLFPGFVFAVWFATDLILTAQGSSQAVKFSTLLVLTILWFGITVPLVYVGSFHGYSVPKSEPPIAVNSIPREIPEQPWYVKPMFSLPMAGVVPFSSTFVELYFILTSVTTFHLFYMFGFLTMVFFIFVVTCIEISISLVYFQFSAENYHWHWMSFFYPAFSAVFFFAYALYYLVSTLKLVSLASVVTFLCYISIATLGFGLFAGSVGYFGCSMFTRKIFSSINKFE
ncbi:hypothetical protein GEMRC1_007616 [Eukaryota sp. GEM-RC1]